MMRVDPSKIKPKHPPVSINSILHGDVENPLEILTNYSNEERIQAQTAWKIGF
jgi:hypothetical protein